jgi:hypothetical protein
VVSGELIVSMQLHSMNENLFHCIDLVLTSKYVQNIVVDLTFVLWNSWENCWQLELVLLIPSSDLICSGLIKSQVRCPRFQLHDISSRTFVHA